MINKTIRAGFLIGMIGILSACSSAPTITQSKVILPVVAKVRSLEFVYYRASMKTSTKGQRNVSFANLGFYDFGELLVNQASAVFAKNNVAIVGAKLLESGQKIDVNASIKGAGNISLPILFVEPQHGSIVSNGHSTMGGDVFAAKLINPATRQTIWEASIDTNVWKGQAALSKNITRDVYDDSYADQFLTQLVIKLKEDGIVE